MNVGDRIHTCRKAQGLTLLELGDKVGVGASTVRKWETGYIKNLKSDKIQKLADALGTTPSYLMGWSEDYTIYKNIEHLPDTDEVPIIGRIACGTSIFADENINGVAEVDQRVHADFALRCVGDSMINARIFDGDLVFIRKQSDVDNGEIAAVIIDENATLKRVYKYKNRIELRPENPLFPVLEYEGAELENIQIIGKAVAFLSNII